MLKKVCSGHEKRRLRGAVAEVEQRWGQRKSPPKRAYSAGGHPGGLKDEPAGLKHPYGCGLCVLFGDAISSVIQIHPHYLKNIVLTYSEKSLFPPELQLP